MRKTRQQTAGDYDKGEDDECDDREVGGGAAMGGNFRLHPVLETKGYMDHLVCKFSISGSRSSQYDFMGKKSNRQ